MTAATAEMIEIYDRGFAGRDIRGLAKTQGGVIARQFRRQVNLKALSLQETDSLLGQHAILEYSATQTNLIDRVLIADENRLPQDRSRNTRVKDLGTNLTVKVPV